MHEKTQYNLKNLSCLKFSKNSLHLHSKNFGGRICLIATSLKIAKNRSSHTIFPF